MTGLFERQYRALRDIRELCAKRPEAFRDDPVAATKRAELDTAIENAKTAFDDHQSGVATHRRCTARRRAGRAALRAGLKAVAQTGPVVAIEAGSGLAFEMPKGCKDEQLLSIATDFHTRAVPYADQFASHKQPPNVIADLPGQIAELDSAIAAQRNARHNHKAVRSAIAQILRRGFDAVDALERIYRNAFRNDPRAISEWEEARRIGPAQPPAADAQSQGPAPADPVKPNTPADTATAPTRVA